MMKKLIILLVLTAFVAACGCTTTYVTTKVTEKREHTTTSVSIVGKVPVTMTHWHHEIITDAGEFDTSDELYHSIEIGQTYNFSVDEIGHIVGIN